MQRKEINQQTTFLEKEGMTYLLDRPEDDFILNAQRTERRFRKIKDV